MKKPATILAIDARNVPVIGMSFEQDCGFMQQIFRHESSKTTENYAQISLKELGEIVNPLDDYG